VEERRRVELRRLLDQPHDRVVVRGRRYALLANLQPLHPEVHDSLLQQGGGARGVRVDASVGDQTVRVLSAGVVEVAQRGGFEDRRVRVGHHDGLLDAGLVEQPDQHLGRVEPPEGLVLVHVRVRVYDVHQLPR
jgi:hypothetical protein